MSLEGRVATAQGALEWIETHKLMASTPSDQAWFGFDVAVEGDTAIVGADQASGGGSLRGAAYVLYRDPQDDSWNEVAELTGSQVESMNHFANSVALSGDVAVVGCAHGGPPFESGEAYVFYRDQGGPDQWGEVARLVASDIQGGDVFGGDVAISGEVIIAGAKVEDEAALSAGAAYVFYRDQGGPDNWGQRAKLLAADPEQGDYFGGSVAIDGDVALIGAEGEDSNGAYAGAAYVVQRDQGGPDSWGQVRKITASDAEADDWFGLSVALDGAVALVGALGESSNGSNAGAAYLFERDLGGNDQWGERAKLTPSAPQSGAQFGQGVALDGSTAIVGAPAEDSPASGAGAVYAFARDLGGADQWGELGRLTASDAEDGDRFGRTVAVSGSVTLVGAHNEDTAGTDAGAAYLFLLLGSLGEVCDEGGECASGHCVEGLCCDSACGGEDPNDCVACSLSGSEGTCSPVPDGLPCSGGTCLAGSCESGAGGGAGSGAGGGSPGGSGPGAGGSGAGGGSGGTGAALLGEDTVQHGVDNSGCGCRLERPQRGETAWLLLALMGYGLRRRRRTGRGHVGTPMQ